MIVPMLIDSKSATELKFARENATLYDAEMKLVRDQVEDILSTTVRNR